MKFCRDCTLLKTSEIHEPYCTRPNRQIIDLVSGDPIAFGDRVWADKERNSQLPGACGPAAVFFTPKGVRHE